MKRVILIITVLLLVLFAIVFLFVSNYNMKRKLCDYERAIDAEEIIWAGYGDSREQDFQNYILGSRVEDGKLYIVFGDLSDDYSYYLNKLKKILNGYEDVVEITTYNEDELRELVDVYRNCIADFGGEIALNLSTYERVRFVIDISVKDLSDDEGKLEKAHKFAEKIRMETGINSHIELGVFILE